MKDSPRKRLFPPSSGRHPERIATCLRCGNEAMRQADRQSHCPICGTIYYLEAGVPPLPPPTARDGYTDYVEAFR